MIRIRTGLMALVAIATLGTSTVVTGTTATAAPCKAIVRVGDAGTCVKHVQRLVNWQLQHQGWGKAVRVDGAFGPKTRIAVKHFQSEVNGFYDPDGFTALAVDGVVGRKTWVQMCKIHGEVGVEGDGGDGPTDNAKGRRLMKSAGC